jgi:putative acetyltransferase
VTCATRARHADGATGPIPEDGAVRITTDSPARDDVRRLLDEHLTDMFATSPAESVHALDHSALLAPTVTFWTARDDDGALLGCGALSRLDVPGDPSDARPGHGEIKSMRTAAHARGQGVASALLETILIEARRREYTRVSLETGSQDFFTPARRLYARHGFTECGPFGSYALDPHSVFMTLELPEPQPDDRPARQAAARTTQPATAGAPARS